MKGQVPEMVTRKLFAKFLREINRENEKIPGALIKEMTDDEVIEGYRSCNCCEDKFWTEEDIAWALDNSCCPSHAFEALVMINHIDRLLDDMKSMRDTQDYGNMLAIAEIFED
jgi:hypothetical protein